MSHGRHTATTPDQTRAPEPAPSLRERVLGRRSTRLSLVAAPLATAAVVSGGLALGHGLPGLHGSSPTALSAADAAARPGTSTSSAAPMGAASRDRSLAISRSADRLVAPSVPVRGKKWTSERLSLRGAPTEKAKTFGTVEAGKRVGVTGDTQGAYTEVVVNGARRWLTTAYLTDQRPAPAATAASAATGPSTRSAGSTGPLASGACSGTSEVENGLTDGAVKVYQAVCHAFPQITTYGGYDGHGEHASGKAIDIMTSDSSLGYEIADFLKAHAAELDLYDIIYRQHIWTPVRSSEGWRSMPDRGDSTANHMDHVHVSVN